MYMPGNAILSKFMVMLALATSAIFAQDTVRLLAHEASGHLGEFAQVCGVIASARYARSSNGGPTYLNFDKPYPDNDFTVIVWRRDRKNFPSEPELLLHHKACVSGKIESYQGKPQIIARSPEQIVFWPLETGPAPED
jgi:hypothetical protein